MRYLAIWALLSLLPHALGQFYLFDRQIYTGGAPISSCDQNSTTSCVCTWGPVQNQIGAASAKVTTLEQIYDCSHNMDDTYFPQQATTEVVEWGKVGNYSGVCGSKPMTMVQFAIGGRLSIFESGSDGVALATCAWQTASATPIPCPVHHDCEDRAYIGTVWFCDDTTLCS